MVCNALQMKGFVNQAARSRGGWVQLFGADEIGSILGLYFMALGLYSPCTNAETMKIFEHMARYHRNIRDEQNYTISCSASGGLMNLSKKVWQEYHSRLRTFIMSRISDEAATDDILQNVFLKMHTGLASLRDETKLKSWLYQITKNAIIDYFRSQKPTVELPEWLPQPESDPGEKVTQDLSQCLQPMIQYLSEGYREAVILSELKGFAQKDIAKMQGISVSGAKSRVQRGRAQLKKMLAECCRLEFDHSGRLIDYERKDGTCDVC